MTTVRVHIGGLGGDEGTGRDRTRTTHAGDDADERAGGSEYGGASGVARTETVAKTRLTTARVMSVVERMVKVAAAMAMKAVAVEATAAEPREVERVRRWRRWNLS